MQIRLNITCTGTLVALTEGAAIVQITKPPLPNRQTTLAIEDDAGDVVQIPARVVGSAPQPQSTPDRPAHQVVVEFLELPRSTAAAVRRLIEGPDAPPCRRIA